MSIKDLIRSTQGSRILLTVDLNWDRDMVRDIGSRAKEVIG